MEPEARRETIDKRKADKAVCSGDNDNEPSSKKKSKKKSHEVFIAVHLGAGDFVVSDKKKEVYRALVKKACQEAMKILLSKGSAGEATVIATKILEDSKVVNAGQGSSLTIDKRVECDAGFMSGDGRFGAVSAVPGVKNPIMVAKKIADLHIGGPALSCGRVPPVHLSGEGAKIWAQDNGVQGCCSDESMISDRCERLYRKYMAKLKNADTAEANDSSKEISDTVGAIALDVNGHVASSVSSGGNWLKQSGRVGHAPAFGCGCWALNGSDNHPSIASSCSGSGEMLTKVHLPKSICYNARQDESFGLVQTISSVLQKDFIHNDLLKYHKESKIVGIISLSWDGSFGEFAWGHTSKSFVVAHLSSSYDYPKIEFSELQKELGKSLVVNGTTF